MTGDFHEKAGLCQAIFWVVSTVHQTADQREAHLTFSLSFLGRFFLLLSMAPIANQREARKAASPILQSPTRPTSIALLVERLLRCQLGVLKWETGAAVSEPN